MCKPAIFKSQPARVMSAGWGEKKYVSTRNLPCLVFESSNTFLTYTWLRQTGQQQPFFLFRISTLLHILHIRLSFGIVHSIIIYSTISKITVRPREIGTGGTGVTSNHDNEAHRGSDSVSYSLICALLFLRASARTLLNFHCLRVTISYQISWRILPQSPS